MPGCAQKKPVTLTKTVFAMDTVMVLTATGENAEEALALAETELYRLDALMNRHSDTSAVSLLNDTGSLVNAELAALVTRAAAVSEITDGAFDCTLAPLIDAWDISGAGRIPDEAEIAGALALTGAASRVSVSGDRITLLPGTCIDLGGVGKGYAGERVREIYEKCGVTGSISLGGDVCLLGPRSAEAPLWRVGLRMPGNEDGIIGVLTLTDTFVVTSGSYERYFVGEDGIVYHHILDPKTGSPARSGLVSVTVITKDGVQADALATAFFVMGADKTKAWLKTHPEVSVILVTDHGTVMYSAALADVFTPESDLYSYEAF